MPWLQGYLIVLIALVGIIALLLSDLKDELRKIRRSLMDAEVFVLGVSKKGRMVKRRELDGMSHTNPLKVVPEGDDILGHLIMEPGQTALFTTTKGRVITVPENQVREGLEPIQVLTLEEDELLQALYGPF